MKTLPTTLILFLLFILPPGAPAAVQQGSSEASNHLEYRDGIFEKGDQKNNWIKRFNRPARKWLLKKSVRFW